MTDPTTANAALWPMAIYFATVIIVTVMITLSYVLGERHRDRQTAEPYESGIVSTGTARVRFDIKFSLIDMFFVLFDLEAVFIFAWAVSVRETGWTAYAEMMLFIGILAAALVYLWRLGALKWAGSVRKKISTSDSAWPWSMLRPAPWSLFRSLPVPHPKSFTGWHLHQAW